MNHKIIILVSALIGAATVGATALARHHSDALSSAADVTYNASDRAGEQPSSANIEIDREGFNVAPATAAASSEPDALISCPPCSGVCRCPATGCVRNVCDHSTGECKDMPVNGC